MLAAMLWTGGRRWAVYASVLAQGNFAARQAWQQLPHARGFGAAAAAPDACLYAVLGVAPEATTVHIKAAFRRTAKRWGPLPFTLPSRAHTQDHSHCIATDCLAYYIRDSSVPYP